MSDPRPGFLDPGSRAVPFSSRLFSKYSLFLWLHARGALFNNKKKGKRKKEKKEGRKR